MIMLTPVHLVLAAIQLGMARSRATGLRRRCNHRGRNLKPSLNFFISVLLQKPPIFALLLPLPSYGSLPSGSHFDELLLAVPFSIGFRLI